MKVEIRKFTPTDNFRFLRLTLDKKYSKELEKSFIGYIGKGIKDLFSKEKTKKFAIIADEKFAGTIALFNVEGFNEIGFYILPNLRMKGIASNAVELIIGYIKKNTMLRNINAITTTDNVASVNILKKNGFRKLKKWKVKNELFFRKKLK